MNKNYLWLSLFALAACSQDELVEQQMPQEMVKGIVMSGADYQLYTPDSRSGVRPGHTPTGGLKLSFVWKGGDVVGIFPMASNTGTEIPNEGTQVTFPMKDGAGTSSANFDGGGWAMKAGYSYAAYYPLINQLLDLDKTQIPVSFGNKVYKGVEKDAQGHDFVDFGESDFMTAEKVSSNQSGGIDFRYKHVGGVVILNCKTETEPSKITKFTISGTDSETGAPIEFIMNGQVDLTQPHEVVNAQYNIKASKFVPGEQPGDKVDSLVIKFDEKFNPEKNFDVYFTMAPNQKLKNQNLLVKYSYIDEVTGETKTQQNRVLVSADIQAGLAYMWDGRVVNENTFIVDQEGTLSELVGYDFQGTSLTLVGRINGDDFTFLKSLPNLQSLNLFEANIVDGGSPATTANSITRGLFDRMSNLTKLVLPATADSIEEGAFARFSNVSTCDLVVGKTLARQIEVADNGTMKLGGAQFKSIKWMEADGVEKDFYTVDAAKHTITTTLDGFISAATVTEALAGGNDLIVKGDISGRDFKSLREAAGCLYNTYVSGGGPKNPNLTSAPLKNLDLSGVKIVESDYVYCIRQDGQYHQRTKDNVLGGWVFNVSNLHSIVLPEGIVKIDEFAFRANQYLVSVNVPSTVTEIKNGVWSQNTSLKSIVIPNTVMKLGANVFQSCYQLSDVKLSDNITFIQTQLFSKCRNLTKLVLPSKADWISEWALAETGLVSLTIPASVEVLKEGILKGVTTLRTLTIDGVKIPMKSSNRGGFNEAFKEYRDSKNCDLILPSFYKDEVRTLSNGDISFGGLVWKSVSFSNDFSGIGFDGVNDEDAF